ncbi:uncharacterized protein EHS24_005718 [Apiotrichum porosum]|uniref:Uncharacterized protein n=1 Tax=Apiotrichum porosum TaxID=105984 RepID=A0A427XZD8_9TREE|nr:uncharacterized protein EHS24_005718 [Apiotrichum porosum]RSH84209.1 hypothetical protein EHS24_005718 [Apiotrichum porosum]
MNGVALITGAASGIGAATVRAFVARGVTRLAVADVQKDKLAAIAAELPNVEIASFVCDVSKEEDVKAMVEGTAEKFGRIDYAVNCAGVAPPPGPTAQCPTEDYDRVVGINQRGVFFCVREQLKVMEKQEPLAVEADTVRNQRGSIVNIASIAGLIALSGVPGYISSKHGVIGLSKAVCAEYGGKGIRCNSIAPGFVDTPMIQGSQVAEMLTQLPPVPMNRVGHPEEIADVVTFLSSTGASFVNGATWTVDGGYTVI